ncbi:MAG: 4-hydroxy-tetrahydrodipicolinate synthase [Xanthomonadales bacterium]|jgi:4-hydroxy-tetrahydrodipicolinate synthase|nr:4-hydroxy-tetrahydrodipicolinate synthase [Xanthomonadales bacterium]
MLQGSIVALLTPMDSAGRIEFDRLPALLDFHLDGGTGGIVVAGTTGESATLEPAEQDALIEHVLGHVDGRIPVLAGSGSTSTAATVARTRRVGGLGVDAALVVTPAYYRPTQAGLLAHYRAVADESPVPVYLYNVPGRTAVDLLPETSARLAEHGQIVGLKEAVPGAERMRTLRQLCGPDFNLLSGDDDSCGAAMQAGADGVISVAANLAPGFMARLAECALGGDTAGLEALESRLRPLLRQLSVETNPIPVKWGAYEMGLAGPGIRLPLLPLTEELRPALKAVLEALDQGSGSED